MERYFENPTIEILESLYEAVNSMDLSRMPKFTWHERQILRASDNRTMFEEMFMDSPEEYDDPVDDEVRKKFIDLSSGHTKRPRMLGKDRHFFETKIEYEGIKLPIKIPLTVNPEEVGDVRNQINKKIKQNKKKKKIYFLN
jgi:DNA repair exonuclease SbcCD nuclease subunit